MSEQTPQRRSVQRVQDEDLEPWQQELLRESRGKSKAEKADLEAARAAAREARTT